MNEIQQPQLYTVTAGVDGSPFEGCLLAVGRLRDTGLHAMWAITPDGDIKTFPLNKPWFSNETNAVNIEQKKSLLRVFSWFLYEKGAREISIWDGEKIVVFKPIAELLEGEFLEKMAEWARQGWVAWAGSLGNAPAGWLKPYAELSENWKECDRQMALSVFYGLKNAGLLREDLL